MEAKKKQLAWQGTITVVCSVGVRSMLFVMVTGRHGQIHHYLDTETILDSKRCVQKQTCSQHQKQCIIPGGALFWVAKPHVLDLPQVLTAGWHLHQRQDFRQIAWTSGCTGCTSAPLQVAFHLLPALRFQSHPITIYPAFHSILLHDGKEFKEMRLSTMGS